MAEHHDQAHDGHMTWKGYALIGLILSVITAVEVAIFYIPALDPVLVPTLLVLSAAKFVIVVLYYMHLKSDSPIFSRVFFGPMGLAVFVIVALLILFKVLPTYIPG